MAIVKFRLSDGGHVGVNPHQVLRVLESNKVVTDEMREMGADALTSIEFSGNKNSTVVGNVFHVMNQLNAGMSTGG